MLRTKVFHTVNAGLYIQSARAKLFVDGLHKGRSEGCSPVPEQIAAQAAGGTGLFFDLDGLFFTHLHGDHFDPALTAQVLALPCQPQLPGAVFSPETGNFALETGTERRWALKDMELTAIPTVHEGAPFAEEPHNSLLVRTPDAALFIAGDAVLDGALGERLLAGNGKKPFQALFINPMQLLSAGGKDFLAALPAEKVFVYHLPFPEDDVYLYGQTAKWTVKACAARFPNLKILAPMQWVELFS